MIYFLIILNENKKINKLQMAAIIMKVINKNKMKVVLDY